MFIVRKIGKLLRGAATPFQIHLACLLGALLGFVPSFTRSPALVIGLVLLLVILNANLLVAGFVGSLAKLASLALMGVSFSIGRTLLDGPTRDLFAAAVNAPLLAYCGLEWYVCSGGLALGFLFGVVAGFVLNVPVRAFRAAMGRAEESSSFYQRNKGNPFVRLLFFVLFGPRHGWESYRDLMNRKVGLPIRIPGAVFAAVVVGGLWFGASKLTNPLLSTALKDGLEQATGATVDLGGVELDLENSRLAVRNLALADAQQLDHDLFRAALLECDVSGTDLLRKRLKLDRVVARDARHGAPRATPGILITPPAEPEPAPPASDADEKTLDEWLSTAQTWKERLAQAKRWLDKLKRSPSTAPADEPTLRERLEREVAERGWRNVAATHLIEGSPLFEVGELIVEGMASEKLDGRPLDLRIENLSTDPALVDGAPRISLRTRDGLFSIDVSLGSEARVPGSSFIDLKCAGLSTASFMAQVEAKTGVKALEGGTIDAGFHVVWSAGGVAAFDTPLDVKVKDATVSLPKVGAAKVKELAVPLWLRGPLDNPRVKLDAAKLADNLIAAGADELGNQLKAKAQSEIEKKAGELEERAKEKLGDEAKKALEGLNPFDRKKRKKDGGN